MTEVDGGHSLDRLFSERVELTRGQAGYCGLGRGRRELSPEVQVGWAPRRTERLFLRWGLTGWGMREDKKFCICSVFKTIPPKGPP